MRANLEFDPRRAVQPAVLTALVEAGMTRDEAYRIVQASAQRAWDERVPFRSLLEGDPQVTQLIGDRLDELFDYGRFLRNVPAVFERLEALDD